MELAFLVKWATWHALWCMIWCMHRCINLAPPVHPMPLDFLAPALHIAPVLGHRCIRPLLDRPVQGHRFNRCNWFLQNSSNSMFLWVLFSCFVLLGLFASSLGSINVHLTNSLVHWLRCYSTLKSQSNGLMGPFSLHIDCLWLWFWAQCWLHEWWKTSAGFMSLEL
jgi:hypothetical protein